MNWGGTEFGPHPLGLSWILGGLNLAGADMVESGWAGDTKHDRDTTEMSNKNPAGMELTERVTTFGTKKIDKTS